MSAVFGYELSFREKIYKNMWSFINLEMIQTMFPEINVFYLEDGACLTADHKNSLCYEQYDDSAGHYFYVDNSLTKKSTYELGLLKEDYDDEDNEDNDGVCHGASIIYTLQANDIINTDDFPLIPFPENDKDYLNNYINILYLYKWLITSRKWDKALKHNFYYDVHWIKRNNKITTKETRTALLLLNQYILKLDTIKSKIN